MPATANIRVTYLYSACVRIETPDVRVVCDPWFTPGAYDGSWFQFPRLDNPLDRVGPVDYIYVSHIHPDHYDPVFLRSYLARHPGAQLIIADFRHNYLRRRMERDGFAPHVVKSLTVGQTHLDIVPNENEKNGSIDPNDIDSALIVRCGERSVVNMNDNLFSESHVNLVRAIAPKPDIALLGYTGAGPYPQTYCDEPVQLAKLAERKKQEFFDRYRRMRDALSPRAVIPFAGQYLLGGKLSVLNDGRGVADAVEVLAFDPTAVVLADGGDASIDAETLRPTSTRTEPYSQAALEAFIATIRDRRMDYEAYIGSELIPQLPIRALAEKGYANAIRRSACDRDHYFCLPIEGGWLVMNVNRNAPACDVRPRVDTLEPRSEVELDMRHLFGLLTGIFHWNNAEVGSHLRVRRYPDVYDREAQHFLNFLHV
jgi:UDP-MurNAc hydroxylase